MAIRVPVTIRFGDCDSASIVYYPRFFDYFHGAMEDAIRILAGMDYPTLIASHRLGFPAVRVECDFRRPLRYGDPVEIEVAIDDIGESSVVWRFRVFVAGQAEPHAEARVVTVCLHFDRYAKEPIPEWLRTRLAATG